MSSNPIKKGVYKHYKGDHYRVLSVAKHSETLEDMVVYECMYANPTSEIWVRPASMWSEKVDFEGKSIDRFTFISDI